MLLVLSTNRYSYLLFFCLLFVSCKKSEDSVTELADNLLVLRTDQVVNVTGTSALGKGYIKVNGSSSITELGFCWSTSPNPTISSSKNIYTGGLGSFSCPMTGLSLGTTYYVRSFATVNRLSGSFGYFTAYGNQVQFTTSASGLPTLTTKGVSVTGTSASSGGDISNTGGSAITARGVCWSTNPNPNITLSTKTTNGTGSGSFTSNINGLSIGTTYYVRAYATNSAGTTGYGNELSFLAQPGLPTISTTTISSISGNSAISGGNVTNSGSTSVTSRGVVWNTSPFPTVDLSTKTINGTGSGSFISNISGLSSGTTYYVRAYATNSAGTGYGSTQTFNTLSNCISVPSLSTTAASSVTGTTAFSGGTNLSVSTGCTITAKGVCWSTIPNPTVSLSTKTNEGAGVGSFTSNINGLSSGTTYYVRAYATNGAGTGYGTNQTFNTLSSCSSSPSISTTLPGPVTSTTAFSGGNSISVGAGCTITAKGVCWSTSPNPTISLTTKTNNGTGTSAYTSNISGLSSSTTYYVRAYATNSGGFTGYGASYSFTTSSSFITIGSGTNSTGSLGSNDASSITPFSTYYHDAKHQYLYKASEIIGAGGSSSGFTISNIAFNILNNSTEPINGLTIKLRSVSSGTSMPVTSSFTTVWTGNIPSGLPSGTPYWTTFSPGFTPFYWNGFSDLVVEICFNNASYSLNSHVQYSTTNFTSNWYQYVDSATGCLLSLNTTNSNTSRPNIRLQN